jgi:potassium-transporting ATPase potassium-binding subunit
MTPVGWLQVVLFMGVLLGLVRPLGGYMARIYDADPAVLNRVGAPVERAIYRMCGVDPAREMRWSEYAFAVLAFNLAGIFVVYALQRFQGWLPLNPEGLGAVPPHLAFNTAVSFATNTDWQSYGGETTLSYLTQMTGLTVQNYLSAATGMAVLVAFLRGFRRVASDTLGSFWVDLVRSTLYILLPLSFVLALALVSQGVVQTFAAAPTVTLVQPLRTPTAAGARAADAAGEAVTGRTIATQTIAVGPAASQIAIKQLGTNGGGFFNANSAHPLENPTPLSNFLECLAIVLVAAALCYTFGVLVGDRRQGWAVLAAMTIVFASLLAVACWAESRGNPALASLGVDQAASDVQAGGNMEGKEVRHGIAASALWAVATTAASNGSVNSMHDSYTPLGGLVPLWLMQLGEVIYGGVGSGLYGMLVFAIIAVFVAGLLIGRTPEYLGKKIEAFEMKMAAVVILVPPFVVLTGTGLAVSLPQGVASAANPGAHGLSEILYAFSSAGNNNGSAFAGLNANVPFYDVALGIAMWISRYWLIVPVLAIAGSLAAKQRLAPGPGTLPTHTPLFVVLLAGTVILVGALTFVPALALGPIVEELMLRGAP